MPSDFHLVAAIIYLMHHFSWLHVGVVMVDDDYGRTAMIEFGMKVEDEGLCLAFSEILYQHYSQENIQHLGKGLS